MYNAIGICGLPKSGKTELCKRLKDIYGWRSTSIGQLCRDRYEQWISENRDRRISFEEYWGRGFFTNDDILKVNEEAREMVSKGNMILDSRYLAVNCKDLNNVATFFLTADIDIRVERVKNSKEYLGKNEKEIRLILENRERDELKRGQEIYAGVFNGNYDYRDPKRFHLLINTGMMSIEQEVEVVRSFLENGK